MRHVHLGLGRFHRAHQAYYLANAGVPISAFSMRGPGEADALRHAGCRYTLRVLGDGCVRDIEISNIDEPLFLGRDRERFFELLEDHDVSTLTLTITEKGYCYGPSGQLDLHHPDLTSSTVPLLVDGLRRRQARHSQPLAVISCDNLSGNGRMLESACQTWARHTGTSYDPRLVSFPNSMVDRIVPAGNSPVVVETEAFHQWVIEDRFLSGRPSWAEQEGVMVVAEVEPFERIKLRLLNACHSLLAYAGLLHGHEFVHQAIADDRLLALVRRLLFEEVGPTLEVPTPLTLTVYGEALLKRFDNPALPHRLAQIAMDGSQKLPQRVLPGVGRSQVLRLCLDAWFTYLWLGLRGERELAISDPMAQRLRDSLKDNFEETVPVWLEQLGWSPELVPRLLLGPAQK